MPAKPSLAPFSRWSTHSPPAHSSIWQRTLIDYRVPICATLMIVALASMFVLTSQSGSSLATYVLAVYVFAGIARWRALFLDRGLLAVVALLVYLPLTSLWSTPWDARDAFGQVARAALVLAFVVSLAECLQVDWFRQRMTSAVALVGALAALAAIVVFFVESPEDERLNGLGQLDTHVKAGLVYAAAALCGLAWLRNAKESPAAWRYAVRIAVALLVVAVILTGSRNAMACGALGVVCLLLCHRVAKPAHFLALMGASVAAALAALLAVYWLVPSGDTFVLPRGLSLRPGIWSAYWTQLVDDGLWFGVGVLSEDLKQVAGWPVLHPHNLYLAVAWQGGLLGLALLLVVVALTSRVLLRHYEEAEAKLALSLWALGLPSYLLDGYELIDKVGWTWLLFWLPVAIGLGLGARDLLDDARQFGSRHP